MLLIWDIHCTRKVIDDIIRELDTFIEQYPDEQTLFFFGDYMYHFSYDRQALLKLFRYFIKLTQQGKHVYVLAWNHDRLSNHFVFSEWKILLDGLVDTLGAWTLEFITQPTIITLEDTPIVCMPYVKHFEWFDDAMLAEDADSEDSALLQSDNANEQWSWRANCIVKKLIETAKTDHPSKQVHLFHHRYINKVQFPGQVARFSFRSPALSSKFLDDSSIRIFSGHLHQPFTYKNYCCLWATWFTSPLESNQVKYLFHYSDMKLTAHEVWIRPHIGLEINDTEKLSLEDIQKQITQNRADAQESFSSDLIDCWFVPWSYVLSTLSLHIHTDRTDFHTLDEYCDTELIESTSEIKVKSKRRWMQQLLSSLEDASLSLDSSIADWKTLLHRFLVARYWDNDAEWYEEILQELNIL